MAHFDWDAALETGHPEIDDQHRRLFALANSVQDAIGAEGADVGDAVYDLTEYVLEHFSDEQALMEECGYSRIAWHRSLHDDLTAETMRITARYMADGNVTALDLAPFLVRWLREHILAEDVPFVAFRHAWESGRDEG